ncbi:MAG: hypothetical protein ACRDWH_00760 [Acidimicrobiia bacterium]
MQFKGSIRAPGDKDPGVRVVLSVDEYHLEIRRDSELIGRYYLADVEVARDIAERFILFLGDDEVEFLADDALQFAYDGVTAMQDGWLTAKKKKRRHRRAADEAARRKDDQTPVERVPAARQPMTDVSESEVIRARRRQTSDRKGHRQAGVPAVVREPQPEPVAKSVDAGAAADVPMVRRAPKIKPVVESKPEPARASQPSVTNVSRRSQRKARSSDGSDSLAARLGSAPPAEATAVENGGARSTLRDRRRQLADQSPAGDEPLGRVRIPEPVSKLKPLPASRRNREVTKAASGEESAESAESKVPGLAVGVAIEQPVDVRFAPEGHHPAETSTGILSKLRRQPRRPENHVHKFRESGSSVGLVRRVCTECAYVSIGSEEE